MVVIIGKDGECPWEPEILPGMLRPISCDTEKRCIFDIQCKPYDKCCDTACGGRICKQAGKSCWNLIDVK